MPTERMGPPPGALPPMRMTASWSGSKRTDRIQVCGARSAPNGEFPSDPPADRQPSDAGALQKAPVAVHHRSAWSGVKALREAFCALREPDRRRRDEERLSRSEQRTGNKPKNDHLTGKAPYKFESISLQRGVCCEPDFRGSCPVREASRRRRLPASAMRQRRDLLALRLLSGDEPLGCRAARRAT